MSSDVRIAAEGSYGIGMNEVAIKLTVPRFAVEVARARLTPAYFNRALTTGLLFAPAEAATAGFVDWTVPAEALDAAATQEAEALCNIDMPSHHATKLRAREGALRAIRAAIDSDITLASFEGRIAARRPAA
jgi:enoyl-CoA hydratase